MHFSSLWLILLLWFCHFVLQSRFPISPFFTAPFFCHLYRPNLGFYASLFVRIPAFMRLCLSAFQLRPCLHSVFIRLCLSASQLLRVSACPHPSFYASLPVCISTSTRPCLHSVFIRLYLSASQLLRVSACPHSSFYTSLPVRIPAFTHLHLSASRFLCIFTCLHSGFYRSLPVYIPAFTHLYLSAFQLLHAFACLRFDLFSCPASAGADASGSFTHSESLYNRSSSSPSRRRYSPGFNPLRVICMTRMRFRWTTSIDNARHILRIWRFSPWVSVI